MKTKICNLCKKEFCDRGCSFLRHRKVCEKLHENKKDIFKMYNEGYSITKLCNIFSLDCKSMRRFFRDNGVKILTSRNTINHSFFKFPTPEMFWLLGLIAADGCIVSDYVWTIAQSGDRGLKVINHIVKILNYSNKISTTKTIGKNSYSISISSKEMIRDLKKYGIYRRKTYSLSLPNFENENNLKSFIRGYIDGDGCVGVYSNIKECKYLSISFVGTENFIDQCIENIPFRISSKVKLRGVWEIRFTGQSAILFGDWLYSDNSLYKHYKYENYFNYINENVGNVRWSYYNKIYFEIKDLLYSENIMKLSKKINIPFQTLYTWKNNPRKVKNIHGFYCIVD